MIWSIVDHYYSVPSPLRVCLVELCNKLGQKVQKGDPVGFSLVDSKEELSIAADASDYVNTVKPTTLNHHVVFVL